MALLEVQDIQVYYGMIQALKGVSFSVNEGEVIALIGANGAGKTTTLHTVTGLLRAKSGHIIYDGQDITKVPPHKIVTMGMAHVPEGRRVFANMTVLQNLKMGAFTRSDKNEIDATIETLYHILDNQAEALEFAIRENSPVTGIPLSELNLKKNLLVGYLNRNGQVRIPRGQDTIQVGDTVIIVTSQKGLRDITDILEK